MVYSNTTYNKDWLNNTAAIDDDTGSSSAGGSSVVFYDFLNNTSTPLLSPAEQRLKLAELQHKSLNNLTKTKALQQQRHQHQQQGLAHNIATTAPNSPYKAHPLLSTKQQFDGIDPQVNLDPNIQDAATNSDVAAELKYQHQLRFNAEPQHKMLPPKPNML